MNRKIISYIHGLSVLKDNIIWIWVQGNEAVVIDPAMSEPVLSWLDEKQLKLNTILQTHHHEDHIGGTKGLLNKWPKASVVASIDDLERIPLQTISVKDGNKLTLMGLELEVMNVAGHTNAHIAYYIPKNDQMDFLPTLFCGDTLFGGGCGRIFEGTAKDMYKALLRINHLPAETRIYCAHEYTESNLRWALSIYPKDVLIEERLKKVSEKRSQGMNTLPTTLEEERKTNLFIRAKDVNEFTTLRLDKDKW